MCWQVYDHVYDSPVEAQAAGGTLGAALRLPPLGVRASGRGARLAL